MREAWLRIKIFNTKYMEDVVRHRLRSEAIHKQRSFDSYTRSISKNNELETPCYQEHV